MMGPHRSQASQLGLRHGRPTRPRPRRARGTIYVFVLAISLIVSVIGVSAIAVSRITLRAAAGTRDAAEAEILARSAVEAAVTVVNVSPNWRSTFLSGQGTAATQLGRGTISWMLVDDKDGDLSDSPFDPVRVVGIGRVGEAVRAYSVVLSSATPLEALSTCLHGSGEVFIKSSKSVSAAGAPLSTNGRVQNDGIIYGDVEAGEIGHTGTITGTLTVPAPAKAMPGSYVFDFYRKIATQIPNPNEIDCQLLSPGHNPWGQPNPMGVYYIDATEHDLTIINSRIHGTLVVKCGSKKLRLIDTVLLHSYRSDCPVLLVDGEVEMNYDSQGRTLNENEAVNMNPPGSPYQDHSDTDQDDEYPSEVRGLVHIRGKLTMKRTARVQGVIICEGDVTIDGFPGIVHDPSIPRTPPIGYAAIDGELLIAPGTWTREPAP